MSSNYPAGVTDAHPHFNPSEVLMHMACDTEEAVVVPVDLVQHGLELVRASLKRSAREGADVQGAFRQLEILDKQVKIRMADSDYDCPFDDDVEVTVDGTELRWTCPVCGKENETDNDLGGPDPDAQREAQLEARYDD